VTTLPAPKPPAYPSGYCIHCGVRVVDIDSHNQPCAKSPSDRHILVLPPDVKDIYMVGIVGDEAPF